MTFLTVSLSEKELILNDFMPSELTEKYRSLRVTTILTEENSPLSLQFISPKVMKMDNKIQKIEVMNFFHFSYSLKGVTLYLLSERKSHYCNI